MRAGVSVTKQRALPQTGHGHRANALRNPTAILMTAIRVLERTSVDGAEQQTAVGASMRWIAVLSIGPGVALAVLCSQTATLTIAGFARQRTSAVGARQQMRVGARRTWQHAQLQIGAGTRAHVRRARTATLMTARAALRRTNADGVRSQTNAEAPATSRRAVLRGIGRGAQISVQQPRTAILTTAADVLQRISADGVA